jgi:hypothetical protein
MHIKLRGVKDGTIDDSHEGLQVCFVSKVVQVNLQTNRWLGQHMLSSGCVVYADVWGVQIRLVSTVLQLNLQTRRRRWLGQHKC